MRRKRGENSMSRPDGLLYSRSHEWVRIEGDLAVVGITDFAVGELGDLAFIELPQTGTTVAREESFGVIESTKSASDIYAPLSGEIVEVNDGLEDDQSPISESPFEDGWLIKIRFSDESEKDQLFDEAGYDEHVKASQH